MAVCKRVLTVFLFFCALNFAAGQEDDVNRGGGFTATLEMAVDIFNLANRTFEHSEVRGPRAQDHSEIQYLISNWEFAKDARASIGYNSDFFGGNFAFQPQIASGSWTFGARLKGWAQFSVFRITLGNDIESVYADWQGSDNGLYIYTGSGWENPDNITDSSGLMVEGLFDPLVVSLAAGDFLSRWSPTYRILQGAANENIYLDRYNTTFSYGARIGYNLGEIGKLNASYKIYHRTTADTYQPEGGNSLELRPLRADAQVFNHIFGLYSSLYFGDLGLTAGYLGSATVYLSEYWNSAAGGMVETGIPVVFRNGVALNARWRAENGMTLRMENAFTFWQDKDYEVFGTLKPNWNINIARKEDAKAYALVNNIYLRNGVGASYLFANRLEGSMFVYNEFEQISAAGFTPGSTQDRHEYIAWKDRLSLSLGMSYRFNPNASVYINVNFADTLTSRSRDLNFQTANFFQSSVHNRVPEPVSTLDNEFTVSIPIGITLNIR